MTEYAYQVQDASGQTRSGTINAPDVGRASDMLRRQGKTILEIRESPAATSFVHAAAVKRVRRNDVIFFATQLAIMVDTGVPIDEALDAIANQTQHTGLQRLVRDLCANVKGGVEFSAALAQHPKLFDELFVALMRASEVSGTMGQMLTRAGEYMESDRQTRKRVKGAMIYPLCMLSFCTLVVIALMVFILPRFEKIYAGKDAALPMPTQILLGISAGMITYWPLILGGLVAVVAGAWMYFRTPDGRIFLDRVRISIPILGPMYRKAYLARSLRTMATMVSSGVSMLEGLAITAKAAGNHFFARIWLDLADSVQEGGNLADSLSACPLMPGTITQMISAGERTGKLAPVMDRIAGFCEEDLKVAIKAITMMIEPVMIIVMGLLIGGIAMALLLPVFSISKVVAH